MEDRRIYTGLTLAGTLPFVACALVPLAGYPAVAPFGDLDRLAATYGLAILSFLTGIHWATQLYRPGVAPVNLFVASNVVFLVVLIAYVAAGLGYAIAAQILAFLLLFLIDDRLHYAGLIAGEYLRVRLVATAIACASLFVVLIA
jgi:hypothetical protein